MDSIEIISSDSEDEIEIKLIKSAANGRLCAPQCIVISGEEFANSVRRKGGQEASGVNNDGAFNVPVLKTCSEASPCSNLESRFLSIDEGEDAKCPFGGIQEKALSFSSQQSLEFHEDLFTTAESMQLETYNELGPDQHDVSSRILEIDTKKIQTGQDNISRSSPQPSVDKTALKDCEDRGGSDRACGNNIGCKNANNCDCEIGGASGAHCEDNAGLNGHAAHENNSMRTGPADSKVEDDAYRKNNGPFSCDDTGTCAHQHLLSTTPKFVSNYECSSEHNVLNEVGIDSRKDDSKLYENARASTIDCKDTNQHIVGSRNDNIYTHEHSDVGEDPMEIIALEECLESDNHSSQDVIMEDESVQKEIVSRDTMISTCVEDCYVLDVLKGLGRWKHDSVALEESPKRAVMEKDSIVIPTISSEKSHTKSEWNLAGVNAVYNKISLEVNGVEKYDDETTHENIGVEKYDDATSHENIGPNAAHGKASQEGWKDDECLNHENAGHATDHADGEQDDDKEKLDDACTHENIGESAADHKVFTETDSGHKYDDAHNTENILNMIVDENSFTNVLPDGTRNEDHILNSDVELSSSVGSNATNCPNMIPCSSSINGPTTTDPKSKAFLERLSTGLIDFLGKFFHSLGESKVDKEICMKYGLNRNHRKPHADKNGMQSRMTPSSLKSGSKFSPPVGGNIADHKSSVIYESGRNNVGHVDENGVQSHNRNSHKPHVNKSGGQSRMMPSPLKFGSKLFCSVGGNMADHKTFVKDELGRNDLGVHVDKNGLQSRMPPSSLKPGPSSLNPGQSADSSQPVVDQKHDEMLIYKEALQSLSQPKLEHDLPEGILTVSLLKHQKMALAWMVQKETKRLPCTGGILADDQGLGKTISIIALIQYQRHLQCKFTSGDINPTKSEAWNSDEDADGFAEDNKVIQVVIRDYKRNLMPSMSDKLHPVKTEVLNKDEDDDGSTEVTKTTKRMVASNFNSLHLPRSEDCNLDAYNDGVTKSDRMKYIGDDKTVGNAKISNRSHPGKSAAIKFDEDDDKLAQMNKRRQSDNDDLERKPVGETSDLFGVKYEFLNTDEDATVAEVDRMQSKNASCSMRPAGGTLIVCPSSIIRQWASELNHKVTDNARLSVLVHHGGSRTKDPTHLAKFDVVLTTYSIVCNEVHKDSLVYDDDDDDDDVDDGDVEERGLDNSDLSSNDFISKKRKISDAGKKENKKRKGTTESHICCIDGPLGEVRWFRVVLDEAQIIKNHKTRVSKACSNLRARMRWCLSGTPIQNTIDDLYSYFQFLKYDPYAVYSSFCDLIKHPILRNGSYGYRRLQAILGTVLLRRTKGTLINGEPIVKLPPKSICLKKVNFSEEERAFYSSLEADSCEQFKAYDEAGTVRENYANILVLLLRLRQACDHPRLAKGSPLDNTEKISLNAARQLPREMLISLLNRLESSLEICAICSGPPKDAVVAVCGHVFCYQCISGRTRADDYLCPAANCNDLLGSDSIFSQSTLRSCISNKQDNGTSLADDEESLADDKESLLSSYSSSKTRAAMEILDAICYPSPEVVKNEFKDSNCCRDRTCDPTSEDSHCKSNAKSHTCAQYNSYPNSPEKAIVFSQWTSMLDLLEVSLNRSLIQYKRFDGSMSLKERDMAVKEFSTNSKVKVMLMSLKAGNLGLNLVAACHVILLDPWWNPTSEDQAIDRAHRLGQTRPVMVSRLTVTDSVEDRILALQEKKRQMVASAFGEDQTGTRATCLSIEDLRYLFMNRSHGR